MGYTIPSLEHTKRSVSFRPNPKLPSLGNLHHTDVSGKGCKLSGARRKDRQVNEANVLELLFFWATACVDTMSRAKVSRRADGEQHYEHRVKENALGMHMDKWKRSALVGTGGYEYRSF
jgi:hypothetical protein